MRCSPAMRPAGPRDRRTATRCSTVRMLPAAISSSARAPHAMSCTTRIPSRSCTTKATNGACFAPTALCSSREDSRTGRARQSMTRDEDSGLISARTLEHYNARAAEFWEGTRDHDVRQNIEALLRHIRAAPPFRILDLGCGPGRDLAAFRALGHEPIGLEGSPPLAAMAREHSGCEVWEQDFLALKLPPDHFDGVFANASLFHVPRQ